MIKNKFAQTVSIAAQEKVDSAAVASRHYAIAMLGLLVVAVFGFNLFIPRDFWVQDEARYAEVVREMLKTGEWLIVHLNGHPYPDKPPVYFWLVAMVGGIVGQGELSFRLVSFLSTLLATVGVYVAGRAWGGVAVGLWSAVVFATSFLTLIVGQIIRMDMLLTAACIFAFHALLRFVESRNKGWLVIFWLCVIGAFAIKGPITLLFTIAPALVWVGAELGWRKIFLIWPFTGLLSVVAVVGLWVTAVILQGGEGYLLTIWHEQLVGRAVKSWSHKQPFYFYLVLLPLLIMPWTGLVFQGLYTIWREQLRYWKSLFIFSVVPLLGISLISGKLFIYLQPLFPILAIAGGYAVTLLINQRRFSKWISLPPVAFLVVCAITLFWIAKNYAQTNFTAVTVIAFICIGLAIFTIFLLKTSCRYWLLSWVATMILLSWLLFGGLTYYLNPLFSPKALGEAVARITPGHEPIGVVHTTRGILNFYSNRVFTELKPEETSQWWAKNHNATLIIKTEDIISAMGAAGIPAHCHSHQIYEIEFKEYHVLAGCKYTG